ncbi:hypothetical protein NRI_0016 [Neorickettsia risticii str. Illinois]|uniref:Uncharacterized protein n=1 Tax=Neorickettsia risticii (strain Illinois) TaxID=434131 RepID=C6V3P8_NEORI|nr:hypothetical protein NRI_0016 [Neorickettsia risticii str. Illinois]
MERLSIQDLFERKDYVLAKFCFKYQPLVSYCDFIDTFSKSGKIECSVPFVYRHY